MLVPAIFVKISEKWRKRCREYGLGSRCHAEPRVGESIGSKHKDMNKLVKKEDRSNGCEHPVPLNHQEIE